MSRASMDGDNGTSVSIGRLTAETGVSSRTIRYYEELGILPEPPRSAGGTRRYTPEYRFYIEGAVALKELGFSLEEIRLVGRLALGLPMTAKQRKLAAEAIREKRQVLEHKVHVLNRLREVLQEEERAGSKGNNVPDPEKLAGILGQER